MSIAHLPHALPSSAHLAAGTDSFTSQVLTCPAEPTLSGQAAKKQSHSIDQRHLGFMFLSPRLKILGDGKFWATDSSFLSLFSNRISHTHMTGFQQSFLVCMLTFLLRLEFCIKHPITLWQINGGNNVNNGNNDRLDFLGLQITADGDCSHETERCLLLVRKAMTNIESILKSRDIILPTKVCLVKAMVFPVVMYGCESWTIKRTEC